MCQPTPRSRSNLVIDGTILALPPSKLKLKLAFRYIRVRLVLDRNIYKPVPMRWFDRIGGKFFASNNLIFVWNRAPTWLYKVDLGGPVDFSRSISTAGFVELVQEILLWAVRSMTTLPSHSRERSKIRWMPPRGGAKFSYFCRGARHYEWSSLFLSHWRRSRVCKGDITPRR